MKFTSDWFSGNIPNFEVCTKAAIDNKFYVEIGSYEGRSTCWLLQNALADDGAMICIDPWNFKPNQHTDLDGQQVFETFLENTGEVFKQGQSLFPVRETSITALPKIAPLTADFIYVDGSHDPSVALQDGCLAWEILKIGGVMLFDDYQYPHEETKRGVDGFLLGFKGKYEIIVNNYQLGIKKCQL